MPYRIKIGSSYLETKTWQGWRFTRSRHKSAVFASRLDAEFVRAQLGVETELEADAYTIAE